MKTALGLWLFTVITISVSMISLFTSGSTWAQSPTEFDSLDRAGKVTVLGGTKQVTAPDVKDATKTVTSTVRDADKVIVRTPRYDPSTGAQISTQDREFSIKGLQADITSMEAEVVKAKAMLARLQAVK